MSEDKYWSHSIRHLYINICFILHFILDQESDIAECCIIQFIAHGPFYYNMYDVPGREAMSYILIVQTSVKPDLTAIFFAWPSCGYFANNQVIIDRVALVKQGDNVIGRIRPSVRLFVCFLVTAEPFVCVSVISGRLQIIA